jgi:hypothetical protein
MRHLFSEDDCVILDLLSGHGLLAAEFAIQYPDSLVLGMGLQNDVSSWKRVRDSERYQSGVWSRFQYLLCDVTRIPLESSTCDLVVNFLGLEDLHMTTGMTGLTQAISEIGRITKEDALIQISMVEYGDSPEEQLAREIWNEIGLNALFLEREEYLRLLSHEGFHPIEEYNLKLGMKMTGIQAKEELTFACEQAPRIFSTYGVRAVIFDELWKKFGDRILEHGVAYWSPIRVIILSKKQNQ